MAYVDAVAGQDSDVRHPRVWLSLGGTQLPCITATVTRKAEGEQDIFSAELAIDDTAEAGYGYAEWADFQPVDVEVLMSLDGNEPTSVITGRIDKPRIHWGATTVTVSGRDKGGPLTEKRRSAQFKNQTSGDIVTKIAQDHGLQPQINGDTGDFAGKLFGGDAVHLLLNLSDHEVLTRLAQREGWRWYVDQSSLIFEPRGQDSDVYTVEWVPPDGEKQTGYATCLDLETDRNMTAAAPTTVSTKSWHHEDAKLYKGTAEANGVGNNTVEIDHHHNGRNQAQVDKISASRLRDAIRHDCNIAVKAPLDLGVTPRQKLQLTGTGTIYDQLYDIDTVAMTIAWEVGSEMTVTGKIAKSGRSGTDDTGTTKDGGIGSDAVAAGTSIPSSTPLGAGGIGRN